MLFLSLVFIASLLTVTLGVPAPPLRTVPLGSLQPATPSLAVSNSTKVTTAQPLRKPVRPAAPYLYKIPGQPYLYIRFDTFGRGVSREDGDILLYRAMHSLAADIQIDPEHEEGPWHPRPFWKLTGNGLTLIMRDGETSLPTLGEIWYCIEGVSRFMRTYGFSESSFRLFTLSSPSDKFLLVAGGFMEKH